MDDTITLRMLASGSSGNCVFVRVGQTRLLIDAGISCRRIERALAEIDESLDDLDALLVTHEHSDHIKGLGRLFAKRPDIAVYATRGTIAASAEHFDAPAGWTPIRADQPFRIADITVEPFELSHDADEPTGFRLDTDGFAMALATDLGYWSDEVAERLLDCRLLIVEANHDVRMLRSGPYPAFLKRRIASGHGHLSNDQARALVSRVAGPELEWLVLAHLSEKNNLAEIAVDEVSRGLAADNDTRVIAASKRPGRPIELERRPMQRCSRAPAQGVLF